MRARIGRKWNVVFAAVVLIAAGCTGNSLDDGDSADVVLEVYNIPQVPPVTTALNGAICTFTVTNMTVSLQNRPKNELVTSPFGDVVMQSVTLSYNWDTLPPTPTRTVNVGGTIAVGSTGTVSFAPIVLGDLTNTYAGHSASVSAVFRGATVAGDAVQASAGFSFSVNSCLCPDDDGDGLCNNVDSCPGCNNLACTGVAWCNVAGNTCTNPTPSCP